MSPSEHELAASLGRIEQRLEDHGRRLERIEVHTRETNGRVKTIELWKARMDGAKWALSWVPTLATGIIGGVVVAIAAAFVSPWL